MRRTPIGMIKTVLHTEYYSTLHWITPVLCIGLHQYSALDYTSTLPRVLRYSSLSTGVLSREYCHKDRVSISHKDRHLWIAIHRGWYLWFVYALGYALAGLSVRYSRLPRVPDFAHQTWHLIKQVTFPVISVRDFRKVLGKLEMD